MLNKMLSVCCKAKSVSYLAVVACSLFSIQAISESLLLDSFESGTLREVRPDQSDPSTRYLWNQYESDPTEGPDPGSEEVTTELAYDGNNSLKVTIADGNAYTQFYPKVNDMTWENARNLAVDSKPWEFDKYNRLRFWVKLPPGVSKAGGGRTNLHVGTYVRATYGDPSSAESGGDHYYHYYDVQSTGQWHQIIVDTHPSHRRGDSGGRDQGVKEYPSGESGYNYFDALTRFYVDIKGGLPSYPAAIYFDSFEFYQETNPENIEQIYGLNGVYVPSTNTVMVGWKRQKDENDVKHEVRYAFNDVFVTGWDNATPAPGGSVSPPGWQGYNGMDWSTSNISVEGRSAIYIAIKPENSTRFRQIKIPVSDSGIAPPKPPSAVSVDIN